MKVRYEHSIPATLDRVLDAYRSEKFYIEKQKSTGAISVDILEWEAQPDGTVRYKSQVSEPSRQPAFIRKSDVDTYVDESTLDPEAGTLVWKITPSVGANQFFLSGLVEFHARGDETRVAYNIEMKVKIPFVGAKVEKYALGKTEEETANQAEFLKRWVARSDS